TVGLSGAEEPVYEGEHSWKLISTANWGGTGIKSQEKRLEWNNGNPEQTFWRVDLNPEQNDALTFWVYALPENGMDNNLGVQLYDNATHNTDDTKVVVWPDKATQTGGWTKFSISFNDLPGTLDLDDINKIQFQHYWPGTFYVDDIRAVKSAPVINEGVLPNGMVQWNAVTGAERYTLQESVSGPMGPWTTVYQGAQTQYATKRLWPAWYRVRWEEAVTEQNPVPYVSDYSEPTGYAPKPVLIDYALLQRGRVRFNTIPQTTQYQVQYRQNKTGAWRDLYAGPATNAGLAGRSGYWYRARGVKLEKGKIVESTEWSPAQAYDVTRGYVTALGTNLLEKRNGAPIIFRGVNLGNLLLNEPEFSGIGGNFTPDNPGDDDEYGIRRTLIKRFGSADILNEFRHAYINETDIDRLMSLGVNFIRLPIYHELVQDARGNYTRFSEIDRIVKFCSQRGIYVLLDLHGAPGAQSSELHSGRADYNRLFENSSLGRQYRTQTVRFWQAMAKHYRNNVFVLGYDLLNEPFGALEHDPTLKASNGLWTLYNTLYQAIRKIDPNHLIVMESIPSALDWQTLPNPSTYRWKNVMYQFHYYGFTFDDQGNISGVMDPEDHQEYLNDKIAHNLQSQYQVPVLIGEFNGFDQRENWEQYFTAFADTGWSWAVWTYKAFNSPTNWGLYNHAGYDFDPVNVAKDTKGEMRAKFQHYTTDNYFLPNKTLAAVLQLAFKNGSGNQALPVIDEIVPAAIRVGTPFTIMGSYFGETKGQGSVLLDTTAVDVLSWSDTRIVAQLAGVEWPDMASLTVATPQGSSDPVTVSMLQPPIVSSVEPTGNPGQMRINGRHFGTSPGKVWFFPNQCYTIEFDVCPQGYASVISWSDTQIECQIPGQALLNGSVFVITDHGNDSEPWW
ncbi:MAG TPA: cellulase family glycosylhydrolase, partial [Candidatus Bathyarchaeia archaeon]|nr:cellulase family glycosylhydrolase [Candidatus Bathyarchaeia archaeon]